MVQALSLAKTEIKSPSTLCLPQDAFNDHVTVQQTVIRDLISFSGLEVLHLHMRAGYGLQHFLSGLPTVLQSMKGLRVLTIQRNNDDNNEDWSLRSLRHTLSSPVVILPHLTKLGLKSVKCGSSDLLYCLHRQPKLENLSLHNIHLTQGNWTTTFDHMQQYLKLRILEFGGSLTELVWLFDQWRAGHGSSEVRHPWWREFSERVERQSYRLKGRQF